MINLLSVNEHHIIIKLLLKSMTITKTRQGTKRLNPFMLFDDVVPKKICKTTASKKTCKHSEEDAEEEESEEANPILPLFKQSTESTKLSCEDNHIYFKCPVTEESVNKLMRIITTMNNDFDNIKTATKIGTLIPNPIYLHLSTDGGDAFMGMAAADAIKNSKLPIHTVIEGKVCSAGTFMSVCGKKRYITAHSYVLIHQERLLTLGTYSAKHDDIKDTHENMKNSEKNLIDLYVENCKGKIKRSMIEKLIRRELFLDAKQCIDMGICDEIWKGEHMV